MIKFEGKIMDAEVTGSPADAIAIEGKLNGRQCRIIIEAPGIAADLANLYGIEKDKVPINIGNGAEF